jgi:hypothetical protein
VSPCGGGRGEGGGKGGGYLTSTIDLNYYLPIKNKPMT